MQTQQNKEEVHMPAITVTVQHNVGLHARPAALFVQTANRFAADINLAYDNKQANAKSILDILALGAGQGAVITIHASGSDADAALSSLKQLVERNFEEGT
jgi:phosphotransferase system HPr (HPr) family protein